MPASSDVAPAPSVAFLLKGPAEFLQAATGSYVLKDELGREVDRGTLKTSEMKQT